jgi:hypothetical protein
MTLAEQVRLEDDLRRYQGTVDALTRRLEHTLIALALTIDAQAAARQQLGGHGRGADHLDDTVANLLTAAEKYRQLARGIRPIAASSSKSRPAKS